MKKERNVEKEFLTMRMEQAIESGNVEKYEYYRSRLDGMEEEEFSGMRRLIEFSNYLQKIGYDIDGLSFQDAVALMIDVENVISEKLTK